ncbi:MAG: hypothetical protein LAP13_03235 [Acidobacteriia bacterium]|nr:hypothetical protein [Terriglobia bacterium]
MDVASELTLLVASKLIVYTFGALIHLFLMVLILGNRRLHRLEWLLFSLMTALFMWNSGNLLALNLGLYYGLAPPMLSGFARLIAFLGAMAAAPLLVHVQAEYFVRPRRLPFSGRVLVLAFYLPLVAAPWVVGNLLGRVHLDPPAALGGAARPLALWIIAALLAGAAFSLASRRPQREPDPRLRRFHAVLAIFQGILAVGLALVYLTRPLPVQGFGGYPATELMLAAVLPGLYLGYVILRYNFLDLRVSRNVAYSVAAIFGLLIYLNLMRRLSGFLEAHEILPVAVTEGVMIFILVVFLEPVKRLISWALHKAVVSEFERVQKLSAEIQDFAKQSGDLEGLKRFVEERTQQQLALGQVTLRAGKAAGGPDAVPPKGKTRRFPICRGTEVIGALEVAPAGAELSGDQFGALELLADQLAAALELCQLIADKVKLERELAEKARLAFLGEMAARIAHNVKNPLSSMKTLVQLLEEDTSLPERVRQDCRLVVNEVDRLNHNISQVLRYAKPARDTDRPVDLSAVVKRVLTLARAEAEQRQVKLAMESSGACPVEGGEEAANDIVSNLVVNALEASASGSTVRVSLRRADGRVELAVEDQGKGIPPDLRGKIFQPFFTTRAGGTGLGLAIVARRLEEIGGSVDCQSPLDGEGDSPGTRFLVRFRAA